MERVKPPRPTGKFKPGQVALERALSKLGIASRTRAREWILAGEVRVNGVVRKDPLFAVVPERARIEVRGERSVAVEPRVFAFHKPRGVVTTHSDEKGRRTVFSFLESLGLHLIAVGRLDFATTGLLLLTNDTRLAAWLTDPASGVRRVYVVTVRGQIAEPELARLRGGLRLTDSSSGNSEQLRAESVLLRKASGKESHLTVELTEGKNREIRRMFGALGHEVTRLKRVAYGGVELGELAPGQFRELTRGELERAFPGAPLAVRNQAVSS
ncbi:MAG: rRNA pseudouridine synthase [Oligoflexia bacterium]|nr:rRNA pseudouridine synthase [Oligoflexia bacterium]